MPITFRCAPELIDRLPRPVPARQALPDWIRTMPAEAFSALHGGEVRTLKHCPPFLDAMMHGFMVPLPCDVRVEAGRLSWDWDLPVLSIGSHPRSPLSFHVPAQVSGTPFHDEGTAILKFNSFWTVQVEPGQALYVTHPVNRLDLPFRLLGGLVDADRFNEVGILFPAVWTDPGFEGTLGAGTPVAQVFPVVREATAMRIEPLDAEGVQRYDATAHALLGTPGVYRKHYRAKAGDGRDDRQAGERLAVSPPGGPATP